MSDPLVFDAATPRLALPLLFPGQSQKEFFVNEALLRADAAIQCVVEGEATSPPVDPQRGQAWLVGEAATGLFSDRENGIAAWTGDGWRFVAPNDGFRVFDRARACFRLFGDTWEVAIAPEPPAGGATIDAESRTAVVSIIERLVAAGVFAAS